MIRRATLLFSLFRPKELKKGVGILFLAFVVALLEIVGVASMMPFFAIMGNPEAIKRSKFLSRLYTTFDFQNAQQFILALGVGVIVLILLSNLIKGISAHINNKYIGELRASLQSRLLTTYVYQPYKYFLNKNSSELNKIVWSDIEFVIGYAVAPFILVFTNLMLLLLVIALIAIVQLKTALLMVLVVAIFLVFFTLLIKRRNQNSAIERGEAAKKGFVILNEVLGGIKDVKVYQQEMNFLDRFLVNTKRYNSLWARSMTVAQIPKFVLETVAFGLLITVTLFIFYSYKDMGVVLPILGLYAFAAYKIIPAVQIIFQGIASVKQGWPSVMVIYHDLSLKQEKDEYNETGQGRLELNNVISLEGISYRYPDTNKNVLEGINLKISANSTIGIVGGTGAGKTTLIDIILGLHKPLSGKILVDDTVIDSSNIKSWKSMIGYVPQHIFLTDTTISENIAFGLPMEEIDLQRVKDAAETANFHHFVMNELPQNYDTVVGERGVRLSGGQKQRLGIARALYHNPRVLVLDEATSALDNLTESYIIKALEALKGKCTIIIVAHRFSTIQKCDKIVVMKHGRVVDEGSYNTLLTDSQEFKILSLIE